MIGIDIDWIAPPIELNWNWNWNWNCLFEGSKIKIMMLEAHFTSLHYTTMN